MIPDIAGQILDCIFLIAIGAATPLVLAIERQLLSKVRDSKLLRILLDLLVGTATIAAIYAVALSGCNGKISIYHGLLPLFGYYLWRGIMVAIRGVKRIRMKILLDKKE